MRNGIIFRKHDDDDYYFTQAMGGIACVAEVLWSNETFRSWKNIWQSNKELLIPGYEAEGKRVYF